MKEKKPSLQTMERLHGIFENMERRGLETVKVDFGGGKTNWAVKRMVVKDETGSEREEAYEEDSISWEVEPVMRELINAHGNGLESIHSMQWGQKTTQNHGSLFLSRRERSWMLSFDDPVRVWFSGYIKEENFVRFLKDGTKEERIMVAGILARILPSLRSHEGVDEERSGGVGRRL